MSEEVRLLPPPKTLANADDKSSSNKTKVPPIVLSVVVVSYGYSGYAVLRSCALSGQGIISKESLQRRLAFSLLIHVSSLFIGLLIGRQQFREIRLEAEVLPARGKKYDPRWDNVKFILTMCVAQSHFVQPFGNERSWIVVIRLIQESFLMQTFAAMSGYLSSTQLNTKRLRAIWRSLASVYIVSQYMYIFVIRIGFALGFESCTSWSSVIGYIPKEINAFSMFWNPWGLTWYLWALILWRILAPLWLELRFPFASSCLVAILSGYVAWPSLSFADGEFMRVEETFAFFPYYILGILARRHEYYLKEAFAWPGAKLHAIFVLFFSLLAIFINVAAMANFSTTAFDFHQILPSFKINTKSTGFFDKDDLDMTSSYKDQYNSKYLYFAWYPRLAAIPMHVLLIFSILTLFGHDSQEIDFPFAVTRRGSNSLLNYIFHYLIILLVLCPLGFYNSFTFFRFLLSLILPCFFAQFWMWPRTAPILRSFLNPRIPLNVIILNNQQHEQE